MAFQLRRDGPPLLVLPDSSTGAGFDGNDGRTENVHLNVVLEVLSTLATSSVNLTPSEREGLAVSQRFLRSSCVTQLFRPRGIPDSRPRTPFTDRLRRDVQHARGDEAAYSVEPLFENVRDQRKLLLQHKLATSSLPQSNSAPVSSRGRPDPAPDLISDAAEEEQLDTPEEKLDALLRETVLRNVIDSVEAGYAAANARSAPAAGNDAKADDFVQRIPGLVAEPVNIWWAQVRDRIRLLLDESVDSYQLVRQ